VIPSIEQEIRDLHALLGSDQDPEGRAFVPLADAYRRAGDPARALELLGRGLERHPDLAAGHLMQALACRDLADDAGAESAFRQVLKLDADNARALVGLGRLIRGAGQEDEAERLVRRGVALDARLTSEGTPDRVPRQSTNPEVVGAESLAPLEWEVLEPVAVPEPEAPSEEALEPTEVVEPAAVQDRAEATEEVAPIEVFEAGPDPDALGGESEPDGDVVPVVDAEPALLRSLAAVVDLDEPGAGAGGAPEALDIEWEVEEFYQPIPEPAVDEPAPPEAATPAAPVTESRPPTLEVDQLIQALSSAESHPVDEPHELVVDAGSLAPDGWGPDSEAPVAVDDFLDPLADTGEAPLELSALAPDALVDSVAPVEEGFDSAAAVEAEEEDDDDDDDSVLPTRTLGELYARQGLTTEAIQVFRDLAEANPTNLEHRARLLELEAELDGGSRRRAAADAPRLATVSPDPDEAPISVFFEALLSWDSEDPSAGAS
jgi:tetratricopeptide (TPR) repeat protein